MTMQVGNQRVVAQIKEKEEAKEEYETAKSEGKSASLLEQERPNVFTMDVANIMPGDTAVIELHYTELINPVDGTYEFVFPTVVGPRYNACDSENPADSASVSQGNTSSGNTSSGNASSGDASRSDTSEDNASYNSVSQNDASSGNDSDSASDSGALHSRIRLHSDNEWTAIPYVPADDPDLGEYHIDITLSTGVPISELTCKSHDIAVSKESDSIAHITLADSGDYAGNRDFILKYRLIGEEIQSGLVCTGNEDENFFMLTIQPPERYTLEEIPPREYIFVLDVSGSMNGYPLDTAKTLIRKLVSDLRETDTFNLFLFSGDSAQMSPESLPATEENIKAAIALINEQVGNGGTELAPTLQKVLELPANEEAARSVIIITDGYISNEQAIFDLINNNMDTASFFSFGIGKSVNSYLVEGIATAGSGESFVVTDSEDAQDCADSFRTYIQSPLLTNISISYEGFEVYDVEPAVPSTLFAQKPIVLFGKYEDEPTGVIRITGKTGLEDYVQEISVADTAVSQDSSALSYLWARSRLDRITGYGTIRNDASVKEEITQLGLEYNMATQYTSFVCVIEEIKNPGGKNTDVNQASPLPLEVSDLAIGSYSRLPEPDSMLLLIMLTVVFLPKLRTFLKQIYSAKHAH